MTVPGPPATGRTNSTSAPFCRAVEFEAIVAALKSEECRAVFISSVRGMGASTLLRKLAEAARESVPVLTLHGSASLSTIPFGAMSGFMGAAKLSDGQTRLRVLRAVLADFERQRGQTISPATNPARVPIIFLDDAHSLDVGTAEVLAQLVMTGTAKLVLTHSHRDDLPQPIPELWLGGVAETFSLQPLNQDQGHRFCVELMGGPVLPATSWHYWSRAAGSPHYMKLLLEDDVQWGILQPRHGSWSTNGGSHAHSEDLKEAVQAELLGLTMAAEEALTLLALSEPLAEDAFQKMAGGAVIQELLDWPLIRYTAHVPPMLELAIPIHGELIRTMAPAAQSKRLHEELSRLVPGEPVNKESRLRHVLWALETGIDLPDESIMQAAVLACKLFASETALELAEKVRGSSYSLRVAMVKARAKYNLGDYREALELMGEPVQKPDSLEDLLFGSLLRASTKSALGMPATAMAADAQQLRLAGESLALVSGSSAANVREQTQGMAALVDLLVFSRTGQYTNLADLAASLTQQRGAETAPARLGRALALALDAERLIAQGLPLQGFARTAEAFAIEHSEEDNVFFLPESIMQRQLTAALCAGEWKKAAGMLDLFAVDAGPIVSSFGAGANVVRGMVMVRAGRLKDAMAALQTGIVSLKVSDPQQLQGFCTAMASYAAARLGLAELCAALLERYVEGTGMFIVVAYERAYIAAARHLLQMQRPQPQKFDGIAALLRQADEAAEDGALMLELNALALLLELGHEEVAQRVSTLARRVEGQWALGVGRFADALARSDGADLIQAAESLEGAGMFDFANLALQAAARILNMGGSGTEAVDTRARLQRVAAGLAAEGALPQAHHGALALTRREREITALAAAGAADKEIAEQLKLSIRTVEGHLYRSYSKLGIESRDQLGSALAAG